MEQKPSVLHEAESRPEPWLRGTLTKLPVEQGAVVHALQLAREDIERWCGGLSHEELSARPFGLPPIAFELRHIVGSLDRLLTYAEGRSLNDDQKKWMAEEMDGTIVREELLAVFKRGLATAEQRIQRIDMSQWAEPRGVGRKQLPTTVAGLLIHCADHTQRHVGQVITTVKVLLALREQQAS